MFLFASVNIVHYFCRAKQTLNIMTTIQIIAKQAVEYIGSLNGENAGYSASSVSANSFNAFSVSKVCVIPCRRTKAIKSPFRSNSSVISTSSAAAIFRKVVIVVLPLIAFDNPTREMPIRSAKSVCVIPLSLRISAILKSLSIMCTYCLHNKGNKLNSLYAYYYNLTTKYYQNICRNE